MFGADAVRCTRRGSIIVVDGDVKLTIAASSLLSDLSGFVTYVDMSDLPQAFWDDVSSDDAGVKVGTLNGDPLPTDLVWMNKSNKTGSLFFRSDLSATIDNEFIISTNPAKYAVDSTYGRNSVWQDYAAVTVLGSDPSDRTGSSVPILRSSPSMFSVASGPHTFAEDPHQGVAWDGAHWYLFDTNAIHKYDAAFNLVLSNTDPIGDTGLSVVNHFGDGTYHNGYLYSLLEEYPTAPYDSQYIVKIDPTDLSIVDTIDISAQGHEVSSICYCPVDGLFYVTDYTDSSVIYKYTTNGVYQGTLPVVRTGTMNLRFQGIEWFRGAFYLTGDQYDKVYRLSPEGQLIETGLFGQNLDGSLEGLCRKGDSLVLLEDPTSADSYIREWTPVELLDSAGGGYESSVVQSGFIDIHGLPTLSSFTLAATGRVDALHKNNTLVSYHRLDAGDTNDRVTMGWSTSQWSIGLWDNNNKWTPRSSAVVPQAGQYYRMHGVYDGTAERRVYINGALNGSESSILAPPGGRDRLLIGAEDDSLNEVMEGAVGFAYLRSGALSQQWIAAETANLGNPGSFYSLSVV